MFRWSAIPKHNNLTVVELCIPICFHANWSMLYALQDVGTVVVSPPNHCAYHLFLMFFYLLGTPAHPRTFSLSPFSLALSYNNSPFLHVRVWHIDYLTSKYKISNVIWLPSSGVNFWYFLKLQFAQLKFVSKCKVTTALLFLLIPPQTLSNLYCVARKHWNVYKVITCSISTYFISRTTILIENMKISHVTTLFHVNHNQLGWKHEDKSCYHPVSCQQQPTWLETWR